MEAFCSEYADSSGFLAVYIEILELQRQTECVERNPESIISNGRWRLERVEQGGGEVMEN